MRRPQPFGGNLASGTPIEHPIAERSNITIEIVKQVESRQGPWARKARGWFLEFRLIPVLLWSYAAVALGTGIAYHATGALDPVWFLVALGMFWMIDIGLAAASVAALLGLLSVYVTNYRQLRSPFSLGLVLFASLFLVENLAAVFFYVTMAETEGANVAIPMLALNAAELVGFGALLYVSWR